MAAINKNFVIKNGLEVDTNLIFADAYNNKVGIGTTNPQYTLHVNGGIGATNAYVSGITTVINELRVGTGGTVFTVLGVGNSIGVGTANPAFLLDIRSPVSTGQTALYVQGDIRVTGDLNIDDISITNLNVSGISTFVGFATFRNNIFVAGISTFVGFATFRNNIFVTGIGTITTLNSTSGTITNLTGTAGTITTLNSTSGTITNLTGTAGTITTFNSTNGTITNLTNTNLNVSGISTFVGFATFRNNIFVAGVGTVTTLNSTSGTITNLTGTAGTITTFNSTNGTITNLTNTNLNVTGIATIATLNATGIAVTNFTVYNNLSVGGISTFTNGPVLIGSGTSTGTASQPLQVNDGAYVSGNLGIGTTNPQSKLHITGQFQSTQANSTSDGGGQIYLNGATGNRIDFNTNGADAPAFTTRSAGTRIVLYPSVTGSNVDYAFGIDSSTLWSSVASSARQFKWYAGTTNIATLKGTGELLLGTATLTGTASQPLQVTGGAYVSGNLGIGATNPSDKLHTLGGNIRVDSATGAVNFWSGAGYYGGIGIAGGLGGSGTDIVIRADSGRSIIFFTGGANDRGRIDNNGIFLVGTATSTGTASQRLQVTGGAYVSGNLGIGSTNPTSKLDVIGDVRVSGVVTATSFVGSGSGLTGIATGLTATIGIQSGGFTVGTGITIVNVVGTGFTADVTGTTANLYLPASAGGVSLGLAIALGG